MKSTICNEAFLVIELDHNNATIEHNKCIATRQSLGTNTEKMTLRSGKAGRLCNRTIEIRTDSGDIVMTVTPTSWTHKTAIVSDSDNQVVCVVREFLNDSTTIFRSEPTFKGQDFMELEGRKYYLFAQIVTSRRFATATATYSIITGVDGHRLPVWEKIYVGKKFSNMKFHAVIETVDGMVAAKIAQEKTTNKTLGPTALHYEIANGVDTTAITCLGAALQPSGSPVGGLVSSGVI